MNSELYTMDDMILIKQQGEAVICMSLSSDKMYTALNDLGLMILFLYNRRIPASYEEIRDYLRVTSPNFTKNTQGESCIKAALNLLQKMKFLKVC